MRFVVLLFIYVLIEKYIYTFLKPKQKVIITHLLHLEEQTFPHQLPMIFTTQKLAEQLRKYCEFMKIKVRERLHKQQ